MKSLSLICLCLIALGLFAQNSVPIQWGSLEKYRGETSKIVNVNAQNFTVVVNRLGLLPNRRKLILRDIAALNSNAEKKIQLIGNNKNLSASAVGGLNNEIVTISSRLTGIGTRTEVFAHKFNPASVEKTVQGEQIISYLNMDSPSEIKELGIAHSQDFSKVAVYYTIPVRPTEFPGFGYVLYDKDKGRFAENTLQLPYQQFQLEFDEAFVSNSGDFYIMAKEYYAINQSLPIIQNNRSFAKIRAFKVIDGKFSEFDINRDGVIIQSMSINTDAQNNFVASGFYADDLFSGVRGVFFMTLDRKTNAVINIKKQPFTSDFLNSGKAAWEQSWRDRSRQVNSRQQALANFKVVDFRPTSDGEFLVIAENQSVVIVARQTGTPQNPKTTYSKEYYFDDLIVYKLDGEGNLSWVKRIPKNQQSTNDEGRYSSIAHGVTSNKVYILFNDMKRNYDSNGMFVEGQFPYPSLFSASNVIAYVEMDLIHGNYTRQSRPGLSETRVILVPSVCEYNYNTNEMILFGEYLKRKRFGYMKFL